MKSDPAPVTAVWLRADAAAIEVLVEIDGRFYEVIRETPGGPISHITEARAFTRTPDRLEALATHQRASKRGVTE